MSEWWVYILKCADGTLYTGATTDVAKRAETHNKGKGAKYTKARRPVIVAYQEKCGDKSTALRREYQIKQLSREEKIQLINQKTDNP